jgi:hypothetical protein
LIKRITTALVALALLTTGAFAGVADPRPVGDPIGICQSGKAVAHTGDTAEFTFVTCTVNRKYMGPNGRLLIRATFSHTNSANNKTLRVRFNGIGGTAYLSQVDTTTAAFTANVRIANRGLTNSQVGAVEGSVVAPTTSAVDTTLAVPIVITGQLANTGETVTLESYSIELVPSK